MQPGTLSVLALMSVNCAALASAQKVSEISTNAKSRGYARRAAMQIPPS
jgi:hypothetical protein